MGRKLYILDLTLVFMKKSERGILVGLIIILIAAFFLLAFEANNQYSIFQEKRHQIKQPEKIESWMSFSQISKILKISPEALLERLNITLKLNPHINLDLYCKQYKQNCTLLVDRINELKAK